MKVCYFTRPFERKDEFCTMKFGNYDHPNFENKQELIDLTNNCLEERGFKPMTEKELALISEKEIPNPDFYAIQTQVRESGHKTATIMICRTKEKAQAMIQALFRNSSNYKIVGQYFDEVYVEIWD